MKNSICEYGICAIHNRSRKMRKYQGISEEPKNPKGIDETIVFALICAALLLLIALMLCIPRATRTLIPVNPSTPPPAVIDSINRWAQLIEAIIHVESRGDSTAVGDNGKAVGILQIWPIYVKDVNRIIRTKRYTLTDRLSYSKSIEMFEIIQAHYNPDRDLMRAIRLHNKGVHYQNKVITAYYKIRNDYGNNKEGNR